MQSSEVKNYSFMLAQLVKRDFKSRFSGSYLGIFWALIQPICMMLVLWFVFTKGLKSAPGPEGIPFVAWFFPAMIMWNFFQDAWQSSTNSVSEYSFLVKKVAFDASVLPLVKILSSAILHVIFVLLVLLVVGLSGVSLTPKILFSFYFFFCALILIMGLSWITASLNVFSKDISQMVGIFLQFGFWLTPIIWSFDRIPEKYFLVLYLHPIFYLTEGYRNSFLGRSFDVPNFFVATLCFWILSLACLCLGKILFNRLKVHFGDVL